MTGPIGHRCLSLRAADGAIYSVRSQNPMSFLGITALLFLVVLLALYRQARRAAKIDPTVVLRDE